MNGSRTDEWGRKYMEKYSLYEEFAGRISNLLQNLVEGENIEVYSVFGRAKTPEEFLRTAGTPPTGEQSVLAGIADLCTVKILVSFPDDVAKVRILSRKNSWRTCPVRFLLRPWIHLNDTAIPPSLMSSP